MYFLFEFYKLKVVKDLILKKIGEWSQRVDAYIIYKYYNKVTCYFGENFFYDELKIYKKLFE